MKPEYLFLLGFFLILFGISLIALSAFLHTNKSKVDVAIGGFIGPIPFGFATSREMLFILILIMVFFTAIYLLMIRMS